jgi:dipeptidyl aminopeptidase/acylaminoacyl peptidase
MRTESRSRRLALLAFVVGATLATSVGAADKRPPTVDDVVHLKAVGGAAMSPDGGRVLFTVRGWEWPDGKGEPDTGSKPPDARTHVWLVPADGSAEARQITFGERGETSPAWSPDGRFISFVAARGSGTGDDAPKPQIWIMSAEGGEAAKLTDAKEGVEAYAWSRDARRIAYLSRDPFPQARQEQRRRKDDARVFEGDFQQTHIWTVDVASKASAEITHDDAFTVSSLSWAPDGTRIAFTASPTPLLRDERDDVYVVSADGKSVERIAATTGVEANPAWSPDGSTIAFTSVPNEAAPHGDGIAPRPLVNARLMLYDVAGRRARDVSSPQFDHNPGSLQWSPDGRRILIGLGARVSRDVFAYDVAAGTYVRLTNGRTLSLGTFSGDGARVAFTMDTPGQPADVYVSGADFASPKKLTTVNPQVADLALGDTEVITWKSDGFEIEGTLLKPAGYVAGRRYPLIVVVHGGPTGAHTNGFALDRQFWAGQGWAVLAPNPRGSSNYGEKFMRANIPDWGGGDYRDIMTGVDAVIARGIADPERLAVMGWSYGGYMTCWIVSQTSRFKAAMMGAGLSNIHSMYGTTDIPGYLAVFYNGYPTAKTLPLYVERSGLTYADRVTTPLLILHGAEDERVPIGQPMEFYRALKDRGKTVELVFYPREGHGLTEYYHQRDRLRRQYEWIATHTLGDGTRRTSQRR